MQIPPRSHWMHGMTYGEYVAKHRRNALGLSVPVGSQWRSDDGTDGGLA